MQALVMVSGAGSKVSCVCVVYSFVMMRESTVNMNSNVTGMWGSDGLLDALGVSRMTSRADVVSMRSEKSIGVE